MPQKFELYIKTNWYDLSFELIHIYSFIKKLIEMSKKFKLPYLSYMKSPEIYSRKANKSIDSDAEKLII